MLGAPIQSAAAVKPAVSNNPDEKSLGPEFVKVVETSGVMPLVSPLVVVG
jgi:hypothetical protein